MDSFIQWFFNGLGTEVVSLIVGVIGGGLAGYHIGKRSKLTQTQKAGSGAKQRQEGTSKNKDSADKKTAKPIFMAKWDGYSNLKKLMDWWDSITTPFAITSVGSVLAHANAQRCDPNVPSLDD